MFSQIKTSKNNKEVISKLTRRLNLGAENVIARLAFSQSVSTGNKMNIDNLLDSGGKEYSKSVLFGDNYDIYIGMICCIYKIHSTNKDISKYIKMHIDDGLDIIDKYLDDKPNIDTFEYITELIQKNI